MPTTSFLSRGEGRIAYDVMGTGPLVVMIPGMGDLRAVFRGITTPLANSGHRVATMDLRGHGDSDATFSDFDDVAAGEDALALIEHLGGPAVIAGNSMGAGAAVWAAAEKPASVTGLILMGPFVRNAPVNPLQVLALRLALLRPWGPAAWSSYYRKLYPGRQVDDLDDHRDRILRSLRRPGHWRAFVRTTRTSHSPAEARLDEVQAPTLVVMGDRDPDFKDPAAEAHWLADRLGGDVLMVPGAGHYPQAEFPEVVLPAVSEFLSRAGRHA